VGFKRQLTPAEIVMQVVYSFAVGYPIKNLVFMGMGEPLLNYDAVFKAIDILTAECGYNLSKRSITVSTSGYAPGIQRLIKDERYINLAFSVGSADPITRLQIMPIEKRHPIIDFIQLLKEYQSLHNRKLTLEYTLLEGVNDSEYHIRTLMNLSQYLNAKINLINLNPHPLIPYKPLSEKTLLKIRDFIQSEQIPVTVRYKKGQDITAACGQLGQSHLMQN
jgi:23S rRNA (adenine2503-C2)-methyltransferase